MTQSKLHKLISFIFLVVLLLFSVDMGAQRARDRRRGIGPVRSDSLTSDTIALDSVGKKKKEPLDAPVIYEANDSIVFTEGGFVNLYGKSQVNYEKIELTAEVITMNMQKLSKNKDFGYIFVSLASLAKLLKTKVGLASDLYKAYKNKEDLSPIILRAKKVS